MKVAGAILLVWALMAFAYWQKVQEIESLQTAHAQKLRAYKTLTVSVTAYTDVGDTALIERPVSGWTCAVSRDHAAMLGKKIWVEGVGVRLVNDLLNARFTNRIDLHMEKAEEAKKWGRQERKIVVL